MRCFVLDEDGVRWPRIVIGKMVAPLVSPWGMRAIHGGICEYFCSGSEEDERSESIGVDGAS